MTATPEAVRTAVSAAEAAADKLAIDIVAIDVSERLAITDVFVIASASNDRQVRAVVEGVEDRLRAEGVDRVRREGERDGRWVLLDYADVVVHVMHVEDRAFYGLERLWRDCPPVELPKAARGRPAGTMDVEESDDELIGGMRPFRP
ncbi:MAG: ribosome silencing factor [Actinomycetales bacterium]